MTNKKELYESIMTVISKEVKRTLNEMYSEDTATAVLRPSRRRPVMESRRAKVVRKRLVENNENLEEGWLKNTAVAGAAALSMLGGPKAMAANNTKDFNDNKPSQEQIVSIANKRCREIENNLNNKVDDFSFNFKDKIVLKNTDKGYVIDYVYTNTGFSQNDKVYHKSLGEFQFAKAAMVSGTTVISLNFENGKLDFKLKESDKYGIVIGDVIVYNSQNALTGRMSPYHNISFASIGNDMIHNAIAGGEVIRVN